MEEVIRTEIKKLIQKAVKSHWDVDLELEEIKINYPPEEFGDYSTNVALALAKTAKSNPMEVAEEIVSKILKQVQDDKFSEIKVVKPGFINFYLRPELLQKQVEEINEKGAGYGKNDLGRNKKIQVEFISANPTGPLTLGNGRGGVYGDVLSNILKKVGFNVTKEYYINDAGRQIDVLMETIREGKGDYIKIIKQTFPKDVIDNAEELFIVGPKGVKKFSDTILKEMIQKTIANMGIEFDVWFSETEELRDTGKDKEIFEWMKNKKLAYKSEDGALWFNANRFGDAKDRVLVKSNGEPTYFGVDCAYHKNKFIERKFDKVINIWGADHHGDVARVKGFVDALGFKGRLEIILMQFVQLIQDGKPAKMSKREGIYILIDDVLKEVGKDVFRYFMLMYSPDTHMNFDLDLAKEQSQKNPVYYVQYANARIHSILAKLKIKNEKGKTTTKNLKLLKHEVELKLIKQLIRFPEIVEDIARDYQVHRLPQYALDLVRQFHKFYEECRVIDEKNFNLTEVRLALVGATQIVLKNVLDLMGISAPEKM